MAEVVDVVVLRDHEALPLPFGERVDCAVQLQQDRAPIQREFGRICVRDVDRTRRLTRRAVPEPAPVSSRRRRTRRYPAPLLSPRTRARERGRSSSSRSAGAARRALSGAWGAEQGTDGAAPARRPPRIGVELVVERPEPRIVATYCEIRARSTGLSSNLEPTRQVLGEIPGAVEPEHGDDTPLRAAP